jgi:hypothetical protein
MNGKNQDIRKIASLALLVFSLLYGLSSFRLKMGTLRSPGPGLIPGVIGVLLVVCTGIYLFRVFGKGSERLAEEEKPAREGKNYRAIIGILACTALFPFILEPLKFIVSTMAASLVMLLLLKPTRWIFSFLLSLGMAVGAFLIFSRFFGVGLPSGFLENFLFRFGG